MYDELEFKLHMNILLKTDGNGVIYSIHRNKHLIFNHFEDYAFTVHYKGVASTLIDFLYYAKYNTTDIPDGFIVNVLYGDFIIQCYFNIIDENIFCDNPRLSQYLDATDKLLYAFKYGHNTSMPY